MTILLVVCVVAGVQHALPVPIQVLIQDQLPIKSDELSEELSFLHPQMDTVINKGNNIIFMILVLELFFSPQKSHQLPGILRFSLKIPEYLILKIEY